MRGELDIYGVFIPSLLAWAIVGFVASIFVRRLLAKLGFYKYVWHRPLFDIALLVVLIGTVVMIANKVLA
ncbi:hypothetical protein HYPDE_37308 [Hyphomicrobium denitrificans 1NES1]|uniref:DUF1656 domain-containing protein n=1 Tax=Hyphomicrobium denitrificans 1NES1 TaxID=670307 RepID=N0B7Z0_9HYPH|nr:DUF1656 domain-containing protein [Hyphomicrobium denitrificans]AGK59133.1 hypothetical protein HYPDE_37308 [Hyphomicrobium denitrificans 1NES1]